MRSKNTPKQLTIKRLLNTGFNDLYNKLVMHKLLEKNESIKLLSIAVILANQDDINLKRLGYRIVLSYGNHTGDYIPLYDLAINTGLIPVAQLAKRFIESREKKDAKSSFINEFSKSYIDSFVEEGITLTEQQLVLNTYFDDEIGKSLYVVAPTSYGKSELIVSTIKKQANRRICVLVPSKSLLAQTKKRVLDAKIDWIERIVSHPEMHDGDVSNAIYILTQERLSRLLNIDSGLTFDFLFVDEAHNLLDKGSRNELLASVISSVCHRNSKVAVKFLTPFVTNISNLHLRTAPRSDLAYFIDEYVKSEVFYIADFRKGMREVSLYEQFTNTFIKLEHKHNGAVSYILENASKKNIIYFNKPKDIEKFVIELANSQPSNECYELNVAIQELTTNLDQDYKLVECLRKGVVYHHGSMTDSVRNYVEYLFRTSKNLKYLVSSSTLLEGVNLPIEKLFMMSTQKGIGNLTASQFKNLVGRVNRFSEIFSSDEDAGLNKLEPEIHLIATDDYVAPNANFESFISNRANVVRLIKDKPENVLLAETEINKNNKEQYQNAISRLENLENGLILNYTYGYVKTRVGQLIVANSVNEIDVLAKEQEIDDELESVVENSIDNTNFLMDVIYKVFICFSDEGDKKNTLERLKNLQAQTFYAMMLDWKIAKTPFKLMIRYFINYWDSLYERTPEFKVYVGKWGDEENDGGHFKHYTRINTKSRKEKVNLAIVRIKEEEDFIEHVLFRFIDILNDLQKLDADFYKKIKYGTTDEHTIRLIRYGLSRSVAELVLRKYRNYVNVNIINNTVHLRPELLKAMKAEGESILQLFEVEMNTGL